MKKYILLSIIFVTFSCSKNKDEKILSESTNKDKSKILNLAFKITEYGDTLAYKELERIYFLNENEADFFYYSNFMAENYDYPRAFMMNYGILKASKKDSRTSKLANYYLLKAYEKKFKSSIYSINERFPNGKIPKSDVYWNEINKR